MGIAAATIFLVRYCHSVASWPKSVVKTVSVAALALAAWIGDAPLGLTLGLAFGALGDFALSRDGAPAFLMGLVAFALGHLAYVALLYQAEAEVAISMQTAAFSVFACVMAWVLVPRAGGLAVPVAGYIGIIAVMGALALGLPAGTGLGVAAALLFAFSDALLGLSLFVLPAYVRTHWPLSAAIWASYYGAQLLFLTAFGADSSA